MKENYFKDNLKAEDSFSFKWIWTCSNSTSSYQQGESA